MRFKLKASSFRRAQLTPVLCFVVVPNSSAGGESATKKWRCIILQHYVQLFWIRALTADLTIQRGTGPTVKEKYIPSLPPQYGEDSMQEKALSLCIEIWEMHFSAPLAWMLASFKETWMCPLPHGFGCFSCTVLSAAVLCTMHFWVGKLRWLCDNGLTPQGCCPKTESWIAQICNSFLSDEL